MRRRAFLKGARYSSIIASRSLMGTSSKSTAAPLTFDLPQELIEKINTCRDRLDLKTASAVVRTAISRFDFKTYLPPAHDHRQISVRLPPAMRAELLRRSRQKQVSVGELLRVALESFSARPAVAGASVKNTTGTIMAKKKPAKKKAVKKKGRK